MKKKVSVDKNSCIGCGMCFYNFQELFKSDENGLSEPINEIVEESSDLENAKDGCPTGAIHVEDAAEEEN